MVDKLNFKVLLLGGRAVGKTSVVRRYVHETFSTQYLETIGMEPYTRYENIKGKSIAFSIWDIAASENFLPLKRFFYKGSLGALIVFDLTRKESLNEVDKWVKEALEYQSGQYFYLIGNKVDLKDQITISDKMIQTKLNELENCVSYIKTSALTGENIRKGFLELGEYIIKMRNIS
jgi:small GTP-binding protein